MLRGTVVEPRIAILSETENEPIWFLNIWKQFIRIINYPNGVSPVSMLLHLEFYSVLRDCERVVFGTTSVELAIVYARELLEDRTFQFGKARLCLIKDDAGKTLHQMRARRLRP
jgi:hypothetical protein